MDVSIWVPVMVAGIAAISGLLLNYLSHRQAGRDVRTNIRADQELLEKLDSDSREFRSLKDHIATRITTLCEHESGARRDQSGIAAGVFCLAVAVALFAPAISYGGWFWVLAAPGSVFGLMGIIGGGAALKKKVRD
ncbi:MULTISPECIES: hypothetical protein [unclassified Rhodococcus (in: high G+C Gram-positive bacteria)]|uniref:hypothetical protein n=1 Tax=unclassified Rhodococcus (in: high G+C Gram-positive bacteria) TaxID=192944 RepID=UPI00163A362A|nr:MULTISPECIES: hypothetical protein [unclassified Rhodococcus (in: high G+C Gram-positive bacteria)]MBC2639660.1 hypothetical protein [Rhodococcus sp. 3A]MBC2895595.1 hypothetical protein [Rhodococcus sp. 4CII]